MPWGVLFLRGYIYIYIYATLGILSCRVYMPLGYPFLEGIYMPLGYPFLEGIYICHWGILSCRVSTYMPLGVFFQAGYLHICHWGYSFRQGIYIYVTGGILSGRVLLYATGGRILF